MVSRSPSDRRIYLAGDLAITLVLFETDIVGGCADPHRERRSCDFRPAVASRRLRETGETFPGGKRKGIGPWNNPGETIHER